ACRPAAPTVSVRPRPPPGWCCRGWRTGERATGTVAAAAAPSPGWAPAGSSSGHPLERPADRLVGAGPDHLAPLVAGRKEALLHVGLELARERRSEIAAMVQPVVGPHRTQHLGYR